MVEDVRPTDEIVVLEWGVDGASVLLDETLRRGSAVLALCADEDQELAALDAGASEALIWPCSEQALLVRLHRACRHARLPFYEALHRHSADAVEFTTSNVVLLDVNPAWEDITGYERHTAIGRTAASLFRTEFADPEYYRQVPVALRESGVWHGQFAARREDGSVSFMQATVASVRDDRDREVGHLSIKRDTAHDSLTRSALHGSENRMQVLMDQATEAVLVHTLDGALIDANAGACQMLGIERSELLGLHARDVYQDEPDALVATWPDLEASGPSSCENTWRRADGTTFPVELSIAPTELVGTDFVLVVARDITERREVEEANQQLTERLRQLLEHLEDEVADRTRALHDALAQQKAIFDNLSDGVVATSPDGRVEAINPAMLDLLGVTGHYVDLPIERLDTALATLAHRCMAETHTIRQDVELPGHRTARVVATPIFAHADSADSGACIGAVMLVHDATLAKEVDRMKTDFIATVSHELRTPLTSVLGFAKLALGRLDRVAPHVPADDRRASKAFDQIRSNLDIIASEGDRLTALINDVLDISKMEAGRVDWSDEALPPSELVDHVVDVTRALFRSGGPELIREVEPDLPEISGDRHRLIQVLINLVSNGVKFTSEGSVTLSVRRTAEGVEFSVGDTGVGIPEEDLETVFDKFRQSRNASGSRARGTGLGLPISRAIVEHHGGTLRVDSTVGEGSRFWFVLPSAASIQSSESTPSTSIAPLLAQIDRLHDQATAEILVVDDDSSVRELLRQLLVDAGHTVRVAENGAQAIDAVRSNPPDLLVLDVVMPGLSGFDVAAVLRSDPQTERIPILVVSILADESRGVRMGVDRYLPKPVEQDELLHAVRALLNPDRASAQRVIVACDDPVQAELIRRHLEEMGDVVVGTCSGGDCANRANQLDADLVVFVAHDPDQADAIRSMAALANTRVLAVIDP